MQAFYCASLSLVMAILIGCNGDKKPDEIHFATSAQYPPFEYMDRGEIKGFDVDLARLVADKLGKIAVFDNIQFSTILPAIASGKDDAAIATLTITSKRQKNFDFTTAYYFASMAVLYKAHQPIVSESQFIGKKIAVQLGSVMEIWLRNTCEASAITAFNTTNQAVEALLAGHVDAVLLDGAQASIYSQKHSGLLNTVITTDTSGYGIALKKNSPLTAQMNQALSELEDSGKIGALRSIWFEGASWKP